MRRIEAQINDPQYIRYRVNLLPIDDPIMQADISAITLYVYDLATDTLIATDDITITEAVYDTLQTWDIDEIGFNVIIGVSGAYLSSITTYRIEVLITPTDGEPFYLEHVEMPTIATYSANGS